MFDRPVLYTHPMSRGRIVRWLLEELGQPYEVQRVDYGPAMKSPAYRAINPMGKVPALRHGAAVVTETAAICAYLADAFPAAGLAPPLSDPARGAYYRWLFFAAGPLEAATTNQALGVVLPEDPQKARRGGLWQSRRGARHPRRRPGPGRVPGGRSLHCRRRLCRCPSRLGHGLWHRRETSALRALCRRAGKPPGRGTRPRARRAELATLN